MLHAKKELLLHVCCAPCATAVFESLANDYRITAFFYNPNIQPYTEYLKRLDQVVMLCSRLNIALARAEQDEDFWRKRTAGHEHEPEGGNRCRLCFETRLTRAVSAALDRGIATVATTLSISPHKNACLINQIGSLAAAAAGIIFLERDFKKNDGYRKSCELSKIHGLYRQNYCGCLYSLPKKSADESNGQ